MKKINLFLIACFIFGICSCEDDNVLIPQNEECPISTTNDSAFFRSEADAVFTAINTISELYPNDNRISQPKNSLTVKNVNRLKSYNSTASNTPGFYIINFEGGGFAMIPNDTRATEVYAYSNEGALYLGENNNVDYFVSLANDYLSYELERSIKDPTGLPITPAPNPSDPNDPRNFALFQHGDHYCHKVPVSETIEGSNDYLLYTTWSQGSPYNNLCVNSSGGYVSAGCVAIALGQIIAYHKKPLSYNGHTYSWNYITQFPYLISYSNGAQSVAELIHDIGVAAGIDYWNNDSGATIAEAYNALGSFGYNRSMANYSYQLITNSLDAERPCYARGDDNVYGHAWVIDGYKTISTTYKFYKQSTLEYCDKEIERKRFVHCNWGWGGTANGFFLNEVFNVEGYNFNNDLKIIYNIY